MYFVILCSPKYYFLVLCNTFSYFVILCNTFWCSLKVCNTLLCGVASCSTLEYAVLQARIALACVVLLRVAIAPSRSCQTGSEALPIRSPRTCSEPDSLDYVHLQYTSSPQDQLLSHRHCQLDHFYLARDALICNTQTRFFFSHPPQALQPPCSCRPTQHCTFRNSCWTFSRPDTWSTNTTHHLRIHPAISASPPYRVTVAIHGKIPSASDQPSMTWI